MRLAPYASRGSRLIGQIIDFLVATIPIGVAMLVPFTERIFAPLLFGVGYLWWIVYYFGCDAFGDGQSVGKRFMDIRVVSARGDGTPCTVGQSIVRNLLLALLGPIDWIFIVGERHQRLGDMLAGTIVVDA